MPGAASAINCGIPGFPFTITDEKLGSGADALGMKVLSNTATGERVEIIWESGGNTERVRLRSPTTGLLRDVLQTNNNNATAVRLNQHYAGNILLPFANRIRNGTYNFFGRAYLLPRNENTPGVRSDALHGFLFNRTLAVRDAGCTNATGVPSVYVTLGYRFDGSQQGSSATPGWPFKLDTALTYALSAGSLSIITRATSLETSQALPWFNGWHPYFAVGSVAQARVEFDSCRSSMQVLTMAPSPAHHGALSRSPWRPLPRPGARRVGCMSFGQVDDRCAVEPHHDGRGRTSRGRFDPYGRGDAVDALRWQHTNWWR
jgi:galactose mutarotase-like enzyme